MSDGISEAALRDMEEDDMTDAAREQQSTIDSFERTMKEARMLFNEKYLSRGGSNITIQGLPGVIDRIRFDKLARFNKAQVMLTLLRNKHGGAKLDAAMIASTLAKEGIRIEDAIDDLIDTANYAIIAVMLIRGEWS